MEFYYKEKIEVLNPKCPPDNYKAIDRESFRWVFDNIDDPRNFKAQAEKNPSVLNDKKDIDKCSFYALSFFTTLQESKDKFKTFSSMGKNAYKRLGTKIARGLLNKDDGVGENPNKSGHFNFHHVRNHEFHTKFTIIDLL